MMKKAYILASLVGALNSPAAAQTDPSTVFQAPSPNEGAFCSGWQISGDQRGPTEITATCYDQFYRPLNLSWSRAAGTVPLFPPENAHTYEVDQNKLTLSYQALLTRPPTDLHYLFNTTAEQINKVIIGTILSGVDPSGEVRFKEQRVCVDTKTPIRKRNQLPFTVKVDPYSASPLAGCLVPQN